MNHKQQFANKTAFFLLIKTGCANCMDIRVNKTVIFVITDN